jgi:transcriptional regulator with XRE-family HTH domain
MSEKRRTIDAMEILHHIFLKDDPEMQQMVEVESVKSEIAQQIYDLRETAGLTQAQLAEKVGSTAEVIDNLEETDYEDHELGDAVLMLHRVAKALGKRIEFQTIPLEAGPTLTSPQPNFRANSPQLEQATR